MYRFPPLILLLLAWMPLYSAFADETHLQLYKPFSPAKSEGQAIRAIKHLPGECFASSQKIKRDDAWRCQSLGKIYDPCFIKQYGNHKEALCPTSPWDKQTVMIDLPSPLENPSTETLDFSRNFPWAIELARGEKCIAIDAGSFYDNMPVHYECNERSQLFGTLQRCKAPWTVLQQKNGRVETAEIKKAWF